MIAGKNTPIIDRHSTRKYQLSTVFVSCCMLFLLTIIKPVYANEFTASVDRNDISTNESFTLTLKINGTSSATKPDIDDLSRDFQVLSQRSSSSMNIINGKKSGSVEWTYQLMPKRSGALLIPSFHSGKLISNAIPLQVSEVTNRSNHKDANRELDIQTDISPENPFVQQQIHLTVRVHSSRSLDGFRLTAPQIDNADFLDLGEHNFEKIENGIRYLVIEHDYVIFPQSSGTLFIPSFQADVALTQPNQRGFLFGTPSENRRLSTNPIKINILAKPTDFSGENWLPASKLTIEDKWDNNATPLHVGDSVTRKITIKAEGLHSSQLPSLELPEIEGLRTYPESPQLSDTHNKKNLLGKREQSIAIVATKAGQFTIPDREVSWWNTTSNRQEKAVLKGKRLNVLPAVLANSTDNQMTKPMPQSRSDSKEAEDKIENTHQASTTNSQDKSPWQSRYWVFSTFILLVLWLLTLYLLAKKQTPSSAPKNTTINARENSKNLFEKCLKACRENHPLEARFYLKQWSQHFFMTALEPSFSEISKLMDNSSISEELTLLEKHLYTDNSEQTWHGGRLAELLETVVRNKNPVSSHKSRKANLPELFPD